MSNHGHDNLRLNSNSTATTSFKRSHDDLGSDIDNSVNHGASGGSNDASERNKRARNGEGAVAGREQTLFSSPSASSSSSGSTISDEPTPSNHADSAPFDRMLVDSEALSIPSAERNTSPSLALPPSAPASSETEDFRVSMERFRAFDSNISVLRHSDSPLPGPSLPRTTTTSLGQAVSPATTAPSVSGSTTSQTSSIWSLDDLDDPWRSPGTPHEPQASSTSIESASRVDLIHDAAVSGTHNERRPPSPDFSSAQSRDIQRYLDSLRDFISMLSSRRERLPRIRPPSDRDVGSQRLLLNTSVDNTGSVITDVDFDRPDNHLTILRDTLERLSQILTSLSVLEETIVVRDLALSVSNLDRMNSAHRHVSQAPGPSRIASTRIDDETSSHEAMLVHQIIQDMSNTVDRIAAVHDALATQQGRNLSRPVIPDIPDDHLPPVIPPESSSSLFPSRRRGQSIAVTHRTPSLGQRSYHTRPGPSNSLVSEHASERRWRNAHEQVVSSERQAQRRPLSPWLSLFSGDSDRSGGDYFFAPNAQSQPSSSRPPEGSERYHGEPHSVEGRYARPWLSRPSDSLWEPEPPSSSSRPIQSNSARRVSVAPAPAIDQPVRSPQVGSSSVGESAVDLWSMSDASHPRSTWSTNTTAATDPPRSSQYDAICPLEDELSRPSLAADTSSGRSTSVFSPSVSMPLLHTNLEAESRRRANVLAALRMRRSTSNAETDLDLASAPHSAAERFDVSTRTDDNGQHSVRFRAPSPPLLPRIRAMQAMASGDDGFDMGAHLRGSDVRERLTADQDLLEWDPFAVEESVRRTRQGSPISEREPLPVFRDYPVFRPDTGRQYGNIDLNAFHHGPFRASLERSIQLDRANRESRAQRLVGATAARTEASPYASSSRSPRVTSTSESRRGSLTSVTSSFTNPPWPFPDGQNRPQRPSNSSETLTTNSNTSYPSWRSARSQAQDADHDRLHQLFTRRARWGVPQVASDGEPRVMTRPAVPPRPAQESRPRSSYSSWGDYDTSSSSALSRREPIPSIVHSFLEDRNSSASAPDERDRDFAGSGLPSLWNTETSSNPDRLPSLTHRIPSPPPLRDASRLGRPRPRPLRSSMFLEGRMPGEYPRFGMSRFGSRRIFGDYMRDEDLDTSYEGLLYLQSILGEARPRGTPQNVITSLPSGMYRDWAVPGETEARCPICLEDYQSDDPVLKVTGCSHWFHRGCLEQWLKGARTCPVCRGHVTGGNTHQARERVERVAGPSASSSSAPAPSTTGLSMSGVFTRVDSPDRQPRPLNVTRLLDYNTDDDDDYRRSSAGRTPPWR